MAWRRPGDMPLSELMMVSLLTHICVTRPQWVKWVLRYVQRNVIHCCNAKRVTMAWTWHENIQLERYVRYPRVVRNSNNVKWFSDTLIGYVYCYFIFNWIHISPETCGTCITDQLQQPTTSFHIWAITWNTKGSLCLFKHHSPRHTPDW